MENLTLRTKVGSLLKLLIDISYPDVPGLSMDNIDINLTFRTNSTMSVTLRKTDLVQETVTEGGVQVTKWYAYVNSNLTGPGELMVRIDMNVPDPQAPGSLRKEIYDYKTNIMIW